MLKNLKDVQPKEGAGAEELEQQVEMALECMLSRQLAPVMLILSDNLVVPKEQDPGDQRGSEYTIVFLSRKG